MTLTYLSGRSWAAISREERLYCAELYFCARTNPGQFARFLNRCAGLNLGEADWELGYEVCFYRDVLHHRGLQKRGSGYPLKRTFDLAMLSSKTIVVIEAKVCQRFDADQGEDFSRDREHLTSLVGNEIQVELVALASSRYFDNFKKYGSDRALGPFGQHRITWKDVYEEYRVELFRQADSLYGTNPARLIEAETVPVSSVGGTTEARVAQLRAEILQKQKLLEDLCASDSHLGATG